MSELTNSQARIYRAILDHWAEKGESPAIRDLMKRLEIKSPNGIVGLLRTLERKGIIEPTNDVKARQIYPLGMRDAIQQTARVMREAI